MVNKAPSKGCHSCRARHVKCDEARPQCHKCTSRGQTCPGYRNAGNIVFKEQFPQLVFKRAGGKKRREEYRNADSPDSSSDGASVEFSTHAKCRPGLSKRIDSGYKATCGSSRSAAVTNYVFIQELYGLLPPSLTLDAEAFCLNFYFEVYLNDASIPLVERNAKALRKMYPETHHQSPFALAVQMLAVQVTSEQLESRMRTALECNISRKAVKALRGAVETPEGDNINYTLAAITLFIHSDHQYSKKTGAPVSDAHLRGAAALIKHLNTDPSQFSKISPEMLSSLRSIACHSVIMQDRDPREDSILWQVGDDLLSHDPGTRLNALMVTVLDFEAQVLDFIEMMSNVPSEHTPSNMSEYDEKLDVLLEVNAVYLQECLLGWLVLCESSQSYGSSYTVRPESEATSLNVAFNDRYLLNQWRCVWLMYLRVLQALLSSGFSSQTPQLLTMVEISLQANEILAALCHDVRLFQETQEATIQQPKRASTSMRTQMADVLLAANTSPTGILLPDGKWYALNIIKWALAVLEDRKVQESVRLMGRSVNFDVDSEYILCMREWRDALQQRYWTGPLGLVINLPALHAASYRADCIWESRS